MKLYLRKGSGPSSGVMPMNFGKQIYHNLDADDLSVYHRHVDGIRFNEPVIPVHVRSLFHN